MVVGRVGAVIRGLAGHDFGHWGASRDAVDGAREVQVSLDLPEVVVAVWREELGRVASGDPADRQDRAGSQVGVDLEDAVDAELGTFAGH